MGFMGALGGAMQKIPGMNTFAKPINSMMQKTPGMKGAPQALGMMPKQKPIGPSPNSMPMQAMAQMGQTPMQSQGDIDPNAAAAGMGNEAYAQMRNANPPPVPFMGAGMGARPQMQPPMMKQRTKFNPQY